MKHLFGLSLLDASEKHGIVAIEALNCKYIVSFLSSPYSLQVPIRPLHNVIYSKLSYADCKINDLDDTMLLSADDSILLIVDAQEKILPAIHQRDDVTSRMRWLAEIALQLHVPVVITEQYPKGLGYTVSSLQDIIESARVVEKTHFSAMREDNFRDVMSDYQRKQVVIMGMETHVCVLQTALDMQQQGYDVFLPSDTVGSRRVNDKTTAIDRMRQVGVDIITSEMAAFEWLEKSGTDTFRHISRNWLK